MKYKIIEEYEHFYLAVNERGYRECFHKVLHKPDKYGYIIKNKDLKHEYEFYVKGEKASER